MRRGGCVSQQEATPLVLPRRAPGCTARANSAREEPQEEAAPRAKQRPGAPSSFVRLEASRGRSDSMEQGLDLSVVALLAILVIGFYVFVIRGRRSEPAPRKPPANGPDPAGSPPPLAFEPFVVGNGQWGEHLRIDVRHRQHGCDAAGAPTSESGAYDPANERLEFWFVADGPDERQGCPIHGLRRRRRANRPSLAFARLLRRLPPRPTRSHFPDRAERCR